MPHYHHHRRRQIVIIPPSTDRTIVFPYNWSTRRFNINHYSPVMTNNAAPTEEVSQFLQELERQLAGFHIAAGHTFLKLMSFGIPILFLAFFIAMPISFIRMSSNSGTSFPTAIPVIFAILFCYVLVFIILNAIFAARGASKLEEVKTNINGFIGQRAEEYKQRGLAWVMPTNFPYWVELWRIDSMQQQNFNGIQMMQQPGFMMTPQPMNMYDNNNAFYSRPGQNANMMMMQPMQMQPMQMQVQPQQGIYVQNQYSNNTFGRYA